MTSQSSKTARQSPVIKIKSNTRGVFILLVSLFIAASLAGCEWLDDLRASILKKTDETVQEVGKTVDEATAQVKKTKDAVEKKIDDVKNAAKELEEAVDAVKKISE